MRTLAKMNMRVLHITAFLVVLCAVGAAPAHAGEISTDRS